MRLASNYPDQRQAAESHFAPRAQWRLSAHVLALIAVAAVATFILIGNVDVRVANASSDDGLIGYSYFFKYPDRFGVDAAFTNYAPAALTSMMNWLPGLLFKHANIDPEPLNLLFVYAQNVLLALSVFYLAWTLVRRLDIAWITALFVLGARPHWMNLALYGDLDWMPYPGNLAIPPLLFSIAFALQERRLAALVLALIGGLVHPLLGAFTVAIVFLLWTFEYVRPRVGADRSAREWWLATLGLMAVTLVFVAPSLVLSLHTPQVPASQLLPTILSNGHTIPWANPDCSYCLPTFVTNSIAVAAFTGLGWFALRLPGIAPNSGRLILAAAIVAGVSLLVHVLAYIAGIEGILKLLLHRSSILLILCGAPLAIAWVWTAFEEGLQSGRWIRAFVASRFLIAPSVAVEFTAMLILAPLNSGSAVRAAVRERLATALRVLGYGLFGLAIARELPRARNLVESVRIALRVPNQAVAPFFNVESHLFELWLASLAVIGLVWLVARRADLSKRRPTFAGGTPFAASPVVTVVVIAALAAGTFLVNASHARIAMSGESRLFADVQRWARTSTGAGDAFIVANTSVYGGWRNYTHRPTVAPYPVGGVYFYPLTAMAYNRRLARFYAEVLGLKLEDVSRRLIDEREFWEFYSRLDERGLRLFARTFGGKYLVRRSEWPALALPIAFRNAGYVVYEIPVG